MPCGCSAPAMPGRWRMCSSYASAPPDPVPRRGHGRVVKGVHFESLRDRATRSSRRRAYGRRGRDELVFLDITASTSSATRRRRW
jgi:hypothetical protein